MKEMIKDLIQGYKEEPREMWESVLLMICWLFMTYFLLWFGSMFMYDM